MRWFSVFLIVFLAGCANPTLYYDYELKLVEPVESNALQYEDENINISFRISPDDVSLDIANKLNKPITLLYERAVYVDQYNSSHNTIHSTLSFLTSEAHSPPKVIPPKTNLSNYFAPVDKVESISKWKTFVLIEPFVRDAKAHPQWEPLGVFAFDAASQKDLDKRTEQFLLEFDKIAEENVGKRIGIFLPIEIDGKVKDYFFKFEITDVKIPVK